MFDAATTVKSNKEKYVYCGYEIAFAGKGTWNFGNDFAKNVVIFDVDNSSLSHADNHKINFSVLDEGLTHGINGSFGAPAKRFSINFSKAKTKFCLSLHENGDNSYLFVNGKKICKFKQITKMSTCHLIFV